MRRNSPLARCLLAAILTLGLGSARADFNDGVLALFSRLIEHYSDNEPDPRERAMAANAFVTVGLYLRDGAPAARIEPDRARALELFRYAATYLGAADAQYYLARMYIDGVGVKKDLRQGVNWLELAL